MKYSAIIVDDELNGSESLAILLKMYCPQIEIISILDNVEDAIVKITTENPDIIFLDIEMPTGSGFEIAERAKTHVNQLIFTTAYENYAIQAIRSKAVDYLLKPICVEDLIKAVNTAIEKIDKSNSDLVKLSSYQESKLSKNKIAIPCSDGLIFIETESISRIEADSNYTHIIQNNGQKITACKTLKEIENQLDPNVFFRIHNTHLVNLQKIEKYIKGDGGFVILSDGALIPVSRSQKNSFLARFIKN